jgi:hypothetical protein
MLTATGIGPWTLGKDLITFTIASVAVTSTGTGGTGGTTWTPGTAVECVGIVRRLNHQTRIGTKDIRPITQVQENLVPVSYGNALQIANIRLSNNTTPGNPLSALVAAGGYCQVIFQDSHELYDGYYVITGYESGFDGMEEQIQSVDLGPVALVSRGQVVRTFVTVP